MRQLAWFLHAVVDGMVVGSVPTVALLVPAGFAVLVCALQDALAYAVFLSRCRAPKRLVKAALADASPGTTYLLEGYPTSAATLKSMGELIGYTPKLAVLLELTEEKAVPKLEEAGSPRPAALQKMASFNMHSKGMLAELSTMGILTKIDATEGPAACLAAARSAIES